MEGDKLPVIALPSAPGAANTAQRGTHGAAVSLPPIPGAGSPAPPPPDPYFSVPAPLLPGHSVFMTATPDELLAGLEEVTALTTAAASEKSERQGPWRAPPAAYRVGSFIRNHRLCIHLRGCTKCREENALAFRMASQSRTRDESSRRSASAGGRRRKKSGSARKKRHSSRSKSPRAKCSALCVHPSTKGRSSSRGRSSSKQGRRSRSAKSPRSGKDGRSGKAAGDNEEFLLPHGSEILLPTDIKRLTVYHNHDFTQMTWEELMALLTTNFRQYPDISDEQLKLMEEIKAEIIEKIEAGRIKVKDPRLRWKTREMMLTLQLNQLTIARDMYRAIWEALSEHNTHMRRLPDLLQVRAFREVHSFKTDYLKSGCTLLRFTQIPGRLCRGINLYQACLAVVIGRRWVLIVLRRRLKRISDRTDEVNTAIDSVLRYKFQQLPTDRMRVSHLLSKLDGLTRWFEDVKQEMVTTVHTLHEELETRRQQQIEETIVATMDAEVEGHEDWKHLYDFNRCLGGLVSDMAARNDLLRGLIEETKRGARRRGHDDQEWHSWLLQERGRQERGGRLNISRTRWMPV